MERKINDLKEDLAEVKAKQKIYGEQIKQHGSDIDFLDEQMRDHEQARDIIILAGEQAQKNFTDRIESLVSSAVQSVYEERDFQCKLILEQKRNRTECRIAVFENDEELNPADDCGGGILDIISLGIKIVLWYLENPRSRNVMILDEPFRWLGALSERAGRMLKELSERLDIQFIIVTHDDNLIPAFDSCYQVNYKDRNSIVEKLK